MVAVAVPIGVAALSPYQMSRGWAYILGGAAGIVGLALLLVQPLLATGALPGLSLRSTRIWHRRTGTALVAAVGLHVGGLYVTSPPDTLDALLLVSPTPFSVYGVLAMWGVVATALLVTFRHRFRYARWRLAHGGLAVVIAGGTVIHALLIEGTMGWLSKLALCFLVLAATALAVAHLRGLRFGRPRG